MTPWFRAAVLCTAALATSATSVRAADIGDYPPEKRYGSAYEDPRYAELYGDEPPEPPAGPLPAPRYVERYDRVPIPRAPIYRDDSHDERYGRYGGYGRHDDRGPSRGYTAGPGCLGKAEVRYRLESQGWQDFHAPEIVDSRVAWVRARRPSGRAFHLQVDRCSGEVIAARPLEPRFGSYEHDDRPRWRY